MEKKKFDIVIANPPYSVDAFKNYLNVGKTNFTLFEHLTERSSQIEALFIERTKQVLADKGLAGIVLPSTILSNTGVYTKAREVLLKYFEIKAITELGSKTFIATGTTTVILFLKRRNDDFLKDRQYFADDLFNNTQYAINVRYVDIERFLRMFTEHRKFNFDSYKIFLVEKIDQELAKTEMFTEYKSAFDDSTETKNLKKKAFFKNYKPKEKEVELTKRFYNYCKDIEKEKFLYFMLCLSDADKEVKNIEDYYSPQQTVIVKTGNDINKQKEFLGYEFQGKKGQEGIKINNNGGKLFDPTNLSNPEKANSYIRSAIINNVVPKIDNKQKENITEFELIELMNFNKVEFEKIINTGIRKQNKLKSKYPILKLGEICEIKIGGTPSRANSDYYQNGNNLWVSISEMNGQIISNTKEKITDLGVQNSNVKLVAKGTTLLSFKLSIGKTAIAGKDLYTNEAIAALEIRQSYNKQISDNFIFKIFDAGIIDLEKLGNNVFGKSLNSTFLKNEVKFPLPPLKIQQKIITEIEKVEQKEIKGLEKIEQLEDEIKTEFKQAVSGKKKAKLDKICISQSGGTPSRKENAYWDNGTINWLRSEVCQNCYVYENQVKEKITELGLEKSSAKLFKKDTVLIALVGATIGRVAYLTFEATTNQNIAGLYPKDEKQLNSKFLFYALMNDFDKNFGDRKGKFTMANMSLIRNLEIALPSIAEQKKLISIIEKKEKEIDKIKLSLENVQTEKEEVLKKYL